MGDKEIDFMELLGLTGEKDGYNERDDGDTIHRTYNSNVNHFSTDHKKKSGKYVKDSYHERKHPGTKGGGFKGKTQRDPDSD